MEGETRQDYRSKATLQWHERALSCALKQPQVFRRIFEMLVIRWFSTWTQVFRVGKIKGARWGWERNVSSLDIYLVFADCNQQGSACNKNKPPAGCKTASQIPTHCSLQLSLCSSHWFTCIMVQKSHAHRYNLLVGYEIYVNAITTPPSSPPPYASSGLCVATCTSCANFKQSMTIGQYATRKRSRV